jgi:hypothetical protein
MGCKVKLGKIRKLDVREIWKHEALDFSKWLSEAENIQYLNDAIGLSLVDMQTEKNVEAFKCDIVCRDEFTDKIVVIENQLESTNHDHLGKIITYASGLKASVIIWIVKNAREEHASAIEWLNAHTDQSVSFFLIQIEIVQIENSDPAPQFKIIEAPNEFSKNLKKAVVKGEASESQNNRFEFWTVFNEVSRERAEFNIRKPSTDHWYDFSIGTSVCHLSAELVNKENKIRINIYIPDDKEQFDIFVANKDNIESVVGRPLKWERLDNKKASRIYTYIDDFSFSKSNNFRAISNKMIDLLVKFRSAFKPYIK